MRNGKCLFIMNVFAKFIAKNGTAKSILLISIPRFALQVSYCKSGHNL